MGAGSPFLTIFCISLDTKPRVDGQYRRFAAHSIQLSSTMVGDGKSFHHGIAVLRAAINGEPLGRQRPIGGGRVDDVGQLYVGGLEKYIYVGVRFLSQGIVGAAPTRHWVPVDLWKPHH